MCLRTHDRSEPQRSSAAACFGARTRNLSARRQMLLLELVVRRDERRICAWPRWRRSSRPSASAPRRASTRPARRSACRTGPSTRSPSGRRSECRPARTTPTLLVHRIDGRALLGLTRALTDWKVSGDVNVILKGVADLKPARLAGRRGRAADRRDAGAAEADGAEAAERPARRQRVRQAGGEPAPRPPKARSAAATAARRRRQRRTAPRAAARALEMSQRAARLRAGRAVAGGVGAGGGGALDRSARVSSPPR